MRILVAVASPEEEEAILQQVVLLGNEPVICENAADLSTDLAAKGSPRLAIVDWSLPDLDPANLLWTLHEQSPTPVEMLAVVSTAAEGLAAIQAGALEFVTRPLEGDELRARLLIVQRGLDLEDQITGLKRELDSLAETDGLTGLLKRGAMLRILDRELERARRTDGFVSFAAGALEDGERPGVPLTSLGSGALVEVSRRLASSIRPYDRMAYCGSGEFFLCLPDTNLPYGVEVARRLRKTLSSQPIGGQPGIGREVSIRFGVVTASGRSPIEIGTLLARAGQALHDAQSAEPNGVASADA